MKQREWMDKTRARKTLPCLPKHVNKLYLIFQNSKNVTDPEGGETQEGLIIFLSAPYENITWSILLTQNKPT